MWNVVNITSTSLTIELENTACHYTDKAYTYCINGEECGNITTNIHTLHNLKPNTTYKVSIKAESGEEVVQEVTTSSESALLNIRDFGAKGDGESMDAAAIQAAIAAAPKGARIVFPAGTYRTTPIFLKSHITIELMEGATLLGHHERDAYPILPGKLTKEDDNENFYFLGTWEGEIAECYASLLTGIGVEDVRIIGEGTLDGNGQNGDWWINCKVKREAWRPRSLYLLECHDILVEGITIKNSPSWTVHPIRSSKLRFINLTLNNPKDSPNTDGIDPESCNGVEILGVKFSLGDDCIAIKSGKISIPLKERRPSENIIIRNCLMQYGHGAVVLGSEMSGGVKNVFVERCFFEDTDRGLRIKTRRGRGNTAIIDQIYVKNIQMKGVLTPFTLNAFYFCDPDGKTEYVRTKEKLAVDERTPLIGSLEFENMECKDAEICAGFIYGLPEQKVKSLTFKNISINFKEDAAADFPEMLEDQEKIAKTGFIIRNVERIELSDVKVNGQIGEAFVLEDVDNYLEA
ncbi:glycoside hydrolase family 28 protein [Cellulosilyticum ruminicola]